MLCRKREPIEAALANHALATDVAAHELGELARDRKAGDLAEIAVDLDARLEQAILYGLAQTDAGVDDVESELQAAVFFFGARMQSDRADRGVFERIVNQSHQHLAQPRGVSNDMAWAACADVDAAGETLVVCARLQVRRHVVDQSVQVDETPGLEAGEIQYVVERVEQAARRLKQRLGMTLLRLVERCRKQKLAHGHDRFHRRSQLMTDRGEQLRLRLVGSLCRLTRLALRLKALDETLYLPKQVASAKIPSLQRR